MPIIYPNGLMERTFLLNKEGGQHLRDRIVKVLDDFECNLAQDSSRLKFFCSMSDDTIEEIFIYNELSDHMNNLEEDDLVEWKIK